jgi:hypothetical protein
MAEQINIGDSYFRIIDVTTKDEDGEKIPYDLTDYKDNYVAIKTGRGIPDDDAYVFKRIPFSGKPSEGKLLINLSPMETSILPSIVDGEIEALYAFVQIGSTITGQVHEVSALKIKTRKGGILYQTPIDKSYDMGCLSETVGWVIDAGSLCEPVSIKVDFGSILINIFMDGGSLSDREISLIDMGKLTDKITQVYDMGTLIDCGGGTISCE